MRSPKGGQPPLDPTSDAPDAQTGDTRRFKGDAGAALANTIKLSDLDLAAFDAAFYPGGHGPLWDLAEDPVSIRQIGYFAIGGKPIAAVCHTPTIVRHAAAGLTDVVPFLVQDMLVANGGICSKGADWASHVVVDGKRITPPKTMGLCLRSCRATRLWADLPPLCGPIPPHRTLS